MKRYEKLALYMSEADDYLPWRVTITRLTDVATLGPNTDDRVRLFIQKDANTVIEVEGAWNSGNEWLFDKTASTSTLVRGKYRVDLLVEPATDLGDVWASGWLTVGETVERA